MSRPISVHVLTFVMLLSTPAAAQIVPGPAGATLRPCDSKSESHNEFFHHRSFFNPLIADIRAPQIAFNFPAFTDAFPHSVKPGVRRIWDVSVGREVPIMTHSNFTEATIGQGCSGWGIWVDLSFHVLEELGKDDSNPIINTDYRFSLAKVKYTRFLKAEARTRDTGDVERNTLSLAFRADLLHHESTHLGDEYVIHAQSLNRGFERFNPSVEFFDLTAGLHWEQNVTSVALDKRPGQIGRLTMLRGGTTAPVRPSASYWSTETLEPNPRPVQPSKRRFEPYVQFEQHWAHRQKQVKDENGNTATVMDRWRPFVSVDLRRRIVFDFYKTSADQKEKTQASVNAMIGMRTWSGERQLAIREFFFRGYYGVNPAGQLRSVSNYWQLGTGVTFTVGNGGEER